MKAEKVGVGIWSVRAAVDHEAPDAMFTRCHEFFKLGRSSFHLGIWGYEVK